MVTAEETSAQPDVDRLQEAAPPGLPEAELSGSPFLWTRPHILPRLISTHVPQRLIGLDQQLNTLKWHIVGAARHGISSTVLVRGLHGSGKSHLISLAIAQAKKELGTSNTHKAVMPKVIRVNAAFTDPLQLCTAICSTLDSTFDAKKKVPAYLLTEKALELLVSGTPILLIVESIEHYLGSESFLYKLFDLCHSETRVICSLYTTCMFSLPSAMSMRVQSRFTYELVDTMQASTVQTANQSLKDTVHQASVEFLRQFLMDRLILPDPLGTASIIVEPSIKRQHGKNKSKKNASNSSNQTTNSDPEMIRDWNSTVQCILKSAEMDDVLSWVTVLTRDCFIYLSLANAIYLAILRSKNKPDTGLFREAIILYMQSSCIDPQILALETLSSEALYLLGAIVYYCKNQGHSQGQNSQTFAVSSAISALTVSGKVQLSSQMYQLMQVSTFELTNAKIIVKHQSGYKLAISPLKLSTFANTLPESIRILYI